MNAVDQTFLSFNFAFGIFFGFLAVVGYFMACETKAWPIKNKWLDDIIPVAAMAAPLAMFAYGAGHEILVGPAIAFVVATAHIGSMLICKAIHERQYGQKQNRFNSDL